MGAGRVCREVDAEDGTRGDVGLADLGVAKEAVADAVVIVSASVSIHPS